MTQPIRHCNVTAMSLQCYFMPQLQRCDTYLLTNMCCLIQITIGLLMKNHFDSCLNLIRKQGSGGAIGNSLTENLMICIHCTGRSLTHFPRSEEKSVYCWSIQGWRGRPQSRLSILDAWLRAIVWKGEYFLQLWLPMYFCATTSLFVFPLFKLNILLASGKCGKRSKRHMSEWVYPVSTPKTPFSNCKM